MTILQREICERSSAIERMGYLMAAGAADITPENERYVQEALAFMLEENEEAREIQRCACG